MKKVLMIFLIAFPVIVKAQEVKTLWKTSIKTLSGVESIVLSTQSQPIIVGRGYETIVNEWDDTLFNTHYALSIGKKIIYYLSIYHTKRTGKIQIDLTKKDAGILDDSSGSLFVNKSDFSGLNYEITGMVTKLSGNQDKRELVLKFVSNKQEHLNCYQIMTFNKDDWRLHYKINN